MPSALLEQLLDLAPEDDGHLALLAALRSAAALLRAAAPFDPTALLRLITSAYAERETYLAHLATLISGFYAPLQVGMACHSAGRALHFSSRDPAESLPLLEIANQCYARVDSDEARYLRGKALVSYSNALYPSVPAEAIPLAQEAIALLQTAPPYERAVALSNLSDIQHYLGRSDDAISTGHAALALLEPLAAADPLIRERVAEIRKDLANAYHLYRGDLVQAQALFAAAHAALDPDAEPRVRGSLAFFEGLLAIDCGRFAAAEQHLAQAAALYREAENQQDLAQVWMHQGRLALAVGDLPEADRLLRMAAHIFQEVADEIAEAEALFVRAQLPAALLGGPAGQLALLARTIDLATLHGNPHALAMARLAEGRALSRLDAAARRQAPAAFRAAEALFTQLGGARMAAICRAGRALAVEPRDPAALQACAAELTAQSAPLEYTELLQAIGEAEEQHGRPDAARAAYRQATSALAALRGEIRHGAQTAAFLGQRRRPYERLLALAAAANDQELLWRALEEPRAAALRDWLQNAGGSITPPDDPGWAELERLRTQLRLRYAAQTNSVSEHFRYTRSTPQEQANVAAIRDLEQQIAARLAELRRHDPHQAAWQSGAISSLAEVQAVLPHDTALITYTLVSRQAKPGRWVRDLWAVLVTKTDLHVVGPLASSDDLVRLRAALARTPLHDRTGDPRPALAELHRYFVAPLAPQLAPFAHLVVALPDDAPDLQLPLGAAFDGTHYLIERHTVSYTPSATIYARCRNLPARPVQQALVAGYGPDLAHLKPELHAVAAALHTTAQMGPLRAAELTAAMHSADLIHLSCHGRVGTDARFALLTIGPNAYLFAHDCFATPLRAELVTLSACDVGREPQATLGMVGGFLAAGARSVLAALWPADDRATYELMRRFYAALTAAPHPNRATALALAQRALLADPDLSHPALWAPFLLTGATDPLR